MLFDPCLAVRLRRTALIVGLCGASVAFAQSSPVFPVLTFEAYPVANAVPMADGDVNGDGAVDTVYVRVAAGPPAVSTLTAALRSKTGGSPTLVAAGQVGCTVNSLMLADLNKDSKLDAVATCSEGTVAVLEGNGDGSSQAPTTYSVASAAKAVTGDFNGDGYPDLAVAMNTGNTNATFAVLLNKGVAGPIGFGAPTVYGGATGGTQLFVGDLNGDGKLDVLAGGSPPSISGTGAYAYMGNGDGTFKAGGYPAFTTHNFVIGDFNGDGIIDSASMSTGPYGQPTGVTVALGGAKGFSNVTAPFGPMSLLHVVDVNGDGKLDLVVEGGASTILLGDGAGNFTIRGTYATPGSYYGPRKEDDGKLSLLYTTPRGFYVLKGNGDGTFTGVLASLASDVATMGDVNGDGLSDIVGFEQTLGAWMTSIGRGNGTFLQVNAITNYLIGFPVLSDFDGDGVADLAEVYSQGGNGADSAQNNLSRVMVLRGAATGSFRQTKPSAALGVKGAVSAVASDFNGDGKTDLAVSYVDSSANTSGVVLALGNGDGTLTAPVGQVVSVTGTSGGKVIVADLNGDGKPDLVWGSTALVNQGGGGFTALSLPGNGTALAIGDVDGDGVPDVMVGQAIYSGKGDGTFQSTALYTMSMPAGATPVTATIADLNGDGSLDVVLHYMAEMAGLSVAYGNGKGGFVADNNVYITGRKAPVNAMTARLNNQAPALPGDNRPDYVSFQDGAATLLVNQTNPAPKPPTPLPTTLTLTAIQTSVFPLQQASLTATLNGAVPTGTITITAADGTVVAQGSVNTVFSNLQTAATFATEGSYTLTAKYSGDSNNAPSTSNTVTIAVAKSATTTQFIPFPPNYNANRTATISVIVSGYNTSGLVTFTSNGTTLGTASIAGGIATLRQKFDVGTYSITASYPGDASNLPSVSAAATLTVVAGPDFSLSATPTSNMVKAGATATYTITITPVNGYSGTVMLNCQGCTGAAIPVFVQPGSPTPVQITLTAPSSTNSGPRALTLGVAQAALLLMLGWSRRGRRTLRGLPLCVVVVGLAIGMEAMSGCSSGKSSNQTTTPSTTYNVVIVGTDAGIEASHTVTLQLIVTQ